MNHLFIALAGFIAICFVLGKLRDGRARQPLTLVSARKLNSELHGLSIVRRGMHLGAVYWPERLFNEHCLITGAPGSGKSTLLRDILSQIRERGEIAIVVDPESEFIQEFWQDGDWVLRPDDARCPYWHPASEIKSEADARAMAASMVRNHNDIWTDSARIIVAKILQEKETRHDIYKLQELAEANIATFSKYSSLIDPKAVPMSAAMLAGVRTALEAFTALPHRSETSREWNIGKWCEKPSGWLWLSSEASVRESCRMIHGVWMDFLIRRLMNRGIEDKRVWIVIDELAVLGYQPMLETLLTGGRKHQLCCMLSYQFASQIEAIYGHHRMVTLTSAPTTKVFFGADQHESAEWISLQLGEVDEASPRTARSR